MTMTTIDRFFLTEQEVREYAEKNGIGGIAGMLRNANEGDWFFNQFRSIEGCEVGYMFIPRVRRELNICIRWKDTTMFVNAYAGFPDRTYALQLTERMDWRGVTARVLEADRPAKIGTPTPRKLDQWRDFLLEYRRMEIQERDRTLARIRAKVEEVRKAFPAETEDIAWQTDRVTGGSRWTCEVKRGGLHYFCTVESTGSINERIEIDSDINLLQATTCDIMAKMCRNGLEDGSVRRYADYTEKWEQEAQEETERLAPYMGQLPEYLKQD